MPYPSPSIRRNVRLRPDNQPDLRPPGHTSVSEAMTSMLEVRRCGWGRQAHGGLVVNRAYGQYCGLAKALDLVGERWTLLIVRELFLGPRRFSDLLEGLP